MNAGMTNYQKGPEFSGVTDTWDVVQKELHCCGVQACNVLLSSRLKPEIFIRDPLCCRILLTGPVKGATFSLMVNCPTAVVLADRSD